MEANGHPLLRVENLRASFPTDRGVVRAVDGVSFELAAGETLGIVGESGSGKSVLARTIMNLLPPTAIIPSDGKVFFAGRDVRTMSRAAMRHFWGPEIAMVFQDPMTSLNPVRRIGIQIRESLQYHRGLSRAASTKRAVELLGEVGIPAPQRRIDQYPHELSGGMRQRVTIAIAIACEPKLLIADEPTTALDVTVQRQILDLLAKLQAERNMSMILITHDLAVVAGQTDRIAVMYAGRILEIMAAQSLFREVRHPYTEALLQSIPRVEEASHVPLQVIAGRPPIPINLPAGCTFAPRCRYTQPTCTVTEPELIVRQSAPSHYARCFYPVGTSEGVESRVSTVPVLDRPDAESVTSR